MGKKGQNIVLKTILEHYSERNFRFFVLFHKMQEDIASMKQYQKTIMRKGKDIGSPRTGAKKNINYHL